MSDTSRWVQTGVSYSMPATFVYTFFFFKAILYFKTIVLTFNRRDLKSPQSSLFNNSLVDFRLRYSPGWRSSANAQNAKLRDGKKVKLRMRVWLLQAASRQYHKDNKSCDVVEQSTPLDGLYVLTFNHCELFNRVLQWKTSGTCLLCFFAAIH